MRRALAKVVLALLVAAAPASASAAVAGIMQGQLSTPTVLQQRQDVREVSLPQPPHGPSSRPFCSPSQPLCSP
jgi:hypothetical protein